jgi:acetolactate synthase-1/2/3 large subunit
MSNAEQSVKQEGWSLISSAFLNAGIEYIFGLPGESISPIQYAVEDTPIKIISTRHEQAATFMAEAYARMTGKVGVVLVTFGPGFTNTISAMVSAQLSNTPIVLIAGGQGPKSSERLGLQDMRQEPIIESIVKKSLVCRSAERIPEYIDMAVRNATQGRPGPVFLEIPIDVLDAEVDPQNVQQISTKVKSRPFDPSDAKLLLEMIEASSQPIIMAGSGAYYSGAGSELTRLTELTGIPTFTIKMGRGIIPDTHPLCFGSSLPIVPGCALTAGAGADLIILLGSRLCLFTGNGKLINPTAKIVQVDIEPEEIGRNKEIDLPIFGDVKALLSECCRLVSDKGSSKKLTAQFSGWVETLTAVDLSEKTAAKKKIPSDVTPVYPGLLAREVDRFMDREDDMIVADGGEAQIWISVARTCRKALNLLDPGLFGCLGAGFPYGIAAKLVNPKRRVLVYTGDGTMGFNFMEIETSIRMGLPLVVVLDNNQKWGMTSNSMKMRFQHYVPGTVELGNPPYHRAVEALGGKGILVESADEIRPALEEAFKSGVTTCINVMTDPEVIGPGTEAFELMKNL